MKEKIGIELLISNFLTAYGKEMRQLMKRLGYVEESEINKLEQKIIETEKVLGALI